MRPAISANLHAADRDAGNSYTEGLLQSALDQVLAAIRGACDIQCGLVYHWDGHRESLVCRAYGNHGPAVVLSELIYHRNHSSFATKVYREPDDSPGLFEPDTDSPDVDQIHRAEYEIDGPMLGVPLKNQRREKVGVLVLWNRRSYNRDVRFEDLAAIESLAGLAASCIDALNYQVAWERLLRRMLDTLRSVQREADRELALRHVLRMNLLGDAPNDPLAFERVRIFLYEAGARKFTGLLCEGMDESSFRGQVITAKNEVCGRLIVESARGGKPGAMTFTHGRGAHQLRLSWRSDHIGQPNREWISAPLVVGGRLLGMIEADNGFGPRPIPREARDLLEAMGAIAAGVLAVHEMTEKLASDYTSLLKEECRIRDKQEYVYKLILMHLTCHFGLKFQRAFYFQNNLDSDRLIFRVATGSIDAVEHCEIASEVATWTYRDLLMNAAPHLDRELNQAMNGFTISVDREVGALLERPLYLADGSRDLTPGLAAMMERLRAVHASCMLTAPVKSSTGQALGVFFVDSPFEGEALKQHQGFAEEDRRALRRFVEDQVSRIFEGNRYINREHARRSREAEIERINVARHDLDAIPSRLGRLVPSCGDHPDRSIMAILNDVQILVSDAQSNLEDIYRRLKFMSSVGPWAAPPQE